MNTVGNSLVDQVTFLPMKDPQIDKCGHTFDKSTYTTIFEQAAKKGTKARCPMSNLEILEDDLVPNLAIKAMVSDFEGHDGTVFENELNGQQKTEVQLGILIKQITGLSQKVTGLSQQVTDLNETIEELQNENRVLKIQNTRICKLANKTFCQSVRLILPKKIFRCCSLTTYKIKNKGISRENLEFLYDNDPEFKKEHDEYFAKLSNAPKPQASQPVTPKGSKSGSEGSPPASRPGTPKGSKPASKAGSPPISPKNAAQD